MIRAHQGAIADPQLDISIVKLAALPAAQAVGFCLLKKKSTGNSFIAQSSLFLAPDIVNFQCVAQLRELLYEHISQARRAELRIATGKVSYLVEISQSGSIFIFEPVNPAANDSVAQTTLPQPASHFNSIALASESAIGLAEFKVDFTQQHSAGQCSFNSFSEAIGLYPRRVLQTLLKAQGKVARTRALGLDGRRLEVALTRAKTACAQLQPWSQHRVSEPTLSIAKPDR